MFKSKRSKSMKNWSISSPMVDKHSSQTLPAAIATTDFTSRVKNISDTRKTTNNKDSVILIAKFDFRAENRNELTLGVGEALKLIERKGNGWILVKPIGRLSEPGLVPASYVRIFRLNNQSSDDVLDEKWLSIQKDEEKENQQVNNVPLEKPMRRIVPIASTQRIISPIEVRKYREGYASSDSSITSEDEQTFSFQSGASSNTSISNSPNNSFTGLQAKETFPITALVKNASSHNGRYWYRVDITMNNGVKRYLCRYYQDFYKLHCSIVEKLTLSTDSEEKTINRNKSLLPYFPDPIPRPDLQTLSTILLQRCQVLNIYIFKIVQNKHKLDYHQIINEWIQPRAGDLEVGPEEIMTNEKIEQLVKPFSNFSQKSNEEKPNEKSKESSDKHSSKETTQIIPSALKPTSLKQYEELSTRKQLTSTKSGSPVSSQSQVSEEIPPRHTASYPKQQSQMPGTVVLPARQHHKKPHNLKISTSVTPPLPAPVTPFQDSSGTSSVSEDVDAPVSSYPSPSVWQSPVMPPHPRSRRSERSASSPTIQEGQETFYSDWLNSPTEPLFSNKQEHTRRKNVSAPTSRITSIEAPVLPSEFVKIKVFSNDDIFALKVKRSTSLQDLKESILMRLECDVVQTIVKLYYKDQEKNCFTPLVENSQIAIAFGQSKISIKVHIWVIE